MIAPADQFGPLRPDIDPAERLVHLCLGLRGEAFADALLHAKTDPEQLEPALARLNALAALNRRYVLASFARLYRAIGGACTMSRHFLAYHPSPIARVSWLGSAVRSFSITTIRAAKAAARGAAGRSSRLSSASAKAMDATIASAIAISSAGTTTTRRFRLAAVLEAAEVTESRIPRVPVSMAVIQGRTTVFSSGGRPASSSSCAVMPVPRSMAHRSPSEPDVIAIITGLARCNNPPR